MTGNYEGSGGVYCFYVRDLVFVNCVGGGLVFSTTLIVTLLSTGTRGETFAVRSLCGIGNMCSIDLSPSNGAVYCASDSSSLGGRGSDSSVCVVGTSNSRTGTFARSNGDDSTI